MSELNPETASMEDLEAAMDRIALGEQVPVLEPAPPEVPEPAAQPEPEPEPAPEPTPEPEPPAEPDLDQELLRAREAELEARAKHWEGIAGRHGSELGQLRRIVQELQAKAARPEQPDEFQTQDAPAPPQKSSTDEAFRSWAIQQAAIAGELEFRAAHPDAKDYEADMKDHLLKTGFDAQSILLSNDPISAQKDVSRAFTEAYWAVKASRESARVAELRTKKAAQTAALSQAKQRAATTAPAAAPAPKPVAKTYDQMDLAEIEAELKRVAPEWRG